MGTCEEPEAAREAAPPVSLARRIARQATEALRCEVLLTPKPGLVDRANTGAHRDMTVQTFMVSADALEPFFERYAAAGQQASDLSDLACELKRTGIEAEAAMFEATGGINTHKGANFTFALFCGAIGYEIAHGELAGESGLDTLFGDVARLAQMICLADLERLRYKAPREYTHGERALLHHNQQGIRGDAMQGYPLLRYALDALRTTPAEDPVRLHRCLVGIMACLNDTNVVHRGGIEALYEHQERCEALEDADLPADELLEELRRYDGELIDRNISPGGAADMLAAAIFLENALN